MKQVTLQPGDYVITEGMTEDDYHTVARAFMNAGAKEGEYPNTKYAFESALECFGASQKDFGLYHGDKSGSGFCDGRHLSIDQVLNAANAGAMTDVDDRWMWVEAASDIGTSKHENVEEFLEDLYEAMVSGRAPIPVIEQETTMTDINRDVLQNNYLQVIIDEMDEDELRLHATQRQEEALSKMCYERFIEEVRQHHPELLPKQKYNHAYTLGFDLHSFHERGEDVTPSMVRQAIAKVLYTVDDAELMENIGAPFDTFAVFDDHLKENDQ